MVMADRGGALVVAGFAAALLVGCATQPAPPPVAATPSVSAEALVGKWGLASYHKEEDRSRTIKEAQAQCNKPYVISKGPNGGLMMYLADKPERQELVMKAGPDGNTYLGPPGDVPTADDRQVLNVDPNSFTTIWVDPDNAARYGTMVYQRCGKRRA
jgi:hypothetical protein